jgi:hypothetical protein
MILLTGSSLNHHEESRPDVGFGGGRGYLRRLVDKQGRPGSQTPPPGGDAMEKGRSD